MGGKRGERRTYPDFFSKNLRKKSVIFSFMARFFFGSLKYLPPYFCWASSRAGEKGQISRRIDEIGWNGTRERGVGQRGEGKPHLCRPYRVRLWRAHQAGEDHLEAEVPHRLVLEVEGLSWLEVEDAAGHWS